MHASWQQQYKYLIFVLIFVSLFWIYWTNVQLPFRGLCATVVIPLTLYPLWRRKRQTPNLSTYVLYAAATYVLYIAWYRLEHLVTYSYKYYATDAPRHVNFEVALLGASPYLILGFVVLIDELFIPRPRIKYFYNVDSLNTKNLETRRQSMLKILADGNIMQLYSKDGLEKAKENAKKLHIDQNRFIFATEQELDTQMKEIINIATLDKPW